MAYLAPTPLKLKGKALAVPQRSPFYGERMAAAR